MQFFFIDRQISVRAFSNVRARRWNDLFWPCRWGTRIVIGLSNRKGGSYQPEEGPPSGHFLLQNVIFDGERAEVKGSPTQFGCAMQFMDAIDRPPTCYLPRNFRHFKGKPAKEWSRLTHLDAIMQPSSLHILMYYVKLYYS